MSLIKNVLQHEQKMAAENKIKQNQVQPTLLRQEESSAWYFNSSIQLAVILFIAVSMILLGFMLSHDHWLMPQHVKPVAHLEQGSPILVKSTNAMTIQMTHADGDANHYYGSGVAFMKNDQATQAISALQTAILINPSFHKAREALSALYIQNNNIGAAMTTLNKGLDLAPDYFPFIKLKAQIFINEGLDDDALNLLTKNMPAIEDHPGYYALLASVYNKEKKYLVAADIYHQLSQVNPDNGQWWFGMGASLRLAGKTNEAKTAYQKALEVGGLKPDVRAYLESQLGS